MQPSWWPRHGACDSMSPDGHEVVGRGGMLVSVTIGRALCPAAVLHHHLCASKQPHQLSRGLCSGDEATEAQRYCPGSRVSGWESSCTCPVRFWATFFGSRGRWGCTASPPPAHTGSLLRAPHQQLQQLSHDPLNRLPCRLGWQGQAPLCTGLDSKLMAWCSWDSRPALSPVPPWGFSSSPEK